MGGKVKRKKRRVDEDGGSASGGGSNACEDETSDSPSLSDDVEVHKKQPVVDKYKPIYKSNHLRQYLESSSEREFVVFMESLEQDVLYGNKGPVYLTKIFQRFVKGVKQLKRINARRICAIFDNPTQANMLLRNEAFLKEHNLKAFIPAAKAECVGVIRHIPVDISNQELFHNLIIIIISRLATAALPDTDSAPPLKTLEDVPGPSSLPFVGSLVHFLPYIGTFGDAAKNSYDLCDALYKTYGPLVKLGPMMDRPPMIFCFDPKDMEQVLRQENQLPIRMGFQFLAYFRKDVKKAVYDGASGLITDHGEEWKWFRTKVNPVMLQPKNIKQYSTVIDEVAQDMVQRLKRIRKADNSIGDAFEVEMNKWALESIGTVALGGRIGCLDEELSEDAPARRLIQCVRDAFEVFDQLDFQPSPWRYFATPAYKKGMKILDELMKLSEMYIKMATEDIKNRKAKAEDKSILEKLLEIDEKVALIMASDMLFAGVDTAAHTMMNVLYHLAANPDKQRLLREEIRSGVEKRSFLKACIKESMRLSPIVSGNLRRTTKDTILGDYLIPKGIDIVMGHEYLSRQESQFPRALEFLPERWLVSKDDPLHYGHAHPMASMPFGFGVRLCIGRRIAELEVETFLARFVDNFHVEWHGPPPKIVSKSLNYMIGPYNYILKDVE